jgi:hypothetical protein
MNLAASGYPHPSTSIFISKKEYSILVIEILYSISISPAPVLSLSHTLYPLFHILFPSLPLSLSPLSLSLSSFSFTGAHARRCLWRVTVANGGLAARLAFGGAGVQTPDMA